MRNSLVRSRTVKMIDPEYLLDLLAIDDYKTISWGRTVVMNEQDLQKVETFFGDESVPVKGGFLGGGWLWLEYL